MEDKDNSVLSRSRRRQSFDLIRPLPEGLPSTLLS